MTALKRLGIKESDKNIEKMINKIKRRVEVFLKELQRAIKVNEERSNFVSNDLEIQERSFLKAKSN